MAPGVHSSPGNMIPANRISPTAQKIQAYFPLPNLAGQTNNFFARPCR